jgi:WXXGXW repeat (2 copies)
MRIMRLIRSLLFALGMLSMSGASSAQVLVSVNFAPPALPIYEQPLCPAEGYIWTPGYWAWSPYGGYYWVPGTWVFAPEPGLLWTPGYWAFDDGLYYWHPGYWGPVVGFYGGIPYGYGYPGAGYYGGYWRGRQFYYNQTVNNVNVTNIHNVYNTTVVNTTTVNRVSYNGGPGGTTARPVPKEEAAARERHVLPTSAQLQHERAASTNHALLASVNQGRPPIAATPRPAEFSGRGVVAASRAGASYKVPANSAALPRTGTPAREHENKVGSNPPPPETELRRTPPAPRSDMPRPPNASERENASPRPEPSRTVPRPDVPRPPSASERENAPRRENTPYPQREVRPENPPHPEKMTRPENAPYPRREPPPPDREMHQGKSIPPDREPPPANVRQERSR